MKFCTNYNQNTYKLKHINDFDEWTITYNPKDDTLLEFLETYKDKRINLYISDNYFKEYLKICKSLCEKYSNLYIKFDKYNENTIEDIVEECIPFFFDQRVTTWDLLQGFIELGVTDVYVCEDLGFNIKEVAATAHNENVNVRIFPNVAQSSFEDTPDLWKFWVRPEDIHLYEDYVDTIEFYYYLKEEQIDVYYEIYKINKKWFGPLDEIIIGLKNKNLKSQYMLPKFGEQRMNCQKKCQRFGLCRICHRVLELKDTLEKAQIYVRQNNDKDIDN